MGILDGIVKATPVGKVVDALDNAGKATAPLPNESTAPAPEAKTPQQAVYEAKTDAMNAKNPSYKPGDAVPRAKGGPVKAGGAKMKNVDNSGLKKEPC